MCSPARDSERDRVCAGSTLAFQTGSSPFGLTQPLSKLVFQSGSLFRHEVPSGGSSLFNGRTFADFELNAAGNTIAATGAGAPSIDNLTITDGTLHLGMTGPFSLKGNISVASGKTLDFNPASAATLTFSGSTSKHQRRGDRDLRGEPERNLE